VKPHGSLYGMAHRREEVAQAVCRAVKDIDPRLYLYIMKKGLIGKVARTMGLRCVFELYADLGYDAQGNLVITRHHESQTANAVAARVVRMVKEGRVRTIDGGDIPIEGNSVCVHSDTPGSIEIVRAVRQGLEEAGFQVASPAL
jgi:5-oxoprolinase (ATP-hydrolysing) subunit A